VGGGYGITNDGLRKAVPFTFSKVGRAEDQQFYFSSLSSGCVGIFHPNLRIAHYKGVGGAVSQAEEKTVVTRFIGDLYRLVIFGELAEKFGIKEKIDPMPGVFAGKLARAQAFLNLLLKSYSFSANGKKELAEILLKDGLAEIHQLKKEIDSGTIQNQIEKEGEEYKSVNPKCPVNGFPIYFCRLLRLSSLINQIG